MNCYSHLLLTQEFEASEFMISWLFIRFRVLFKSIRKIDQLLLLLIFTHIYCCFQIVGLCSWMCLHHDHHNLEGWLININKILFIHKNIIYHHACDFHLRCTVLDSDYFLNNTLMSLLPFYYIFSTYFSRHMSEHRRVSN